MGFQSPVPLWAGPRAQYAAEQSLRCAPLFWALPKVHRVLLVATVPCIHGTRNTQPCRPAPCPLLPASCCSIARPHMESVQG